MNVKRPRLMSLINLKNFKNNYQVINVSPKRRKNTLLIAQSQNISASSRIGRSLSLKKTGKMEKMGKLGKIEKSKIFELKCLFRKKIGRLSKGGKNGKSGKKSKLRSKSPTLPHNQPPLKTPPRQRFNSTQIKNHNNEYNFITTRSFNKKCSQTQTFLPNTSTYPTDYPSCNPPDLFSNKKINTLYKLSPQQGLVCKKLSSDEFLVNQSYGCSGGDFGDLESERDFEILVKPKKCRKKINTFKTYLGEYGRKGEIECLGIRSLLPKCTQNKQNMQGKMKYRQKGGLKGLDLDREITVNSKGFKDIKRNASTDTRRRIGGKGSYIGEDYTIVYEDESKAPISIKSNLNLYQSHNLKTILGKN